MRSLRGETMTARTAGAVWHGDVLSGSGTITVGPGVFEGPYSAASRFRDEPRTNPEQLIAAGLAGCYTMTLSSVLGLAGHAAKSLDTSADVRLRFVDGNVVLSRIDLKTDGDVDGLDQAQFAEYATQAKATCPVARALAGIGEITVEAHLTHA
jgi:lipoyl-dependent peroxiredoxin